ncbi:MAG TPA: hypothetical protein VFO07_04950, partial [Roseiflexaceae bacterium]|nr:hypothetical protein [Roseiflexaceae bacterium]
MRRLPKPWRSFSGLLLALLLAACDIVASQTPTPDGGVLDAPAAPTATSLPSPQPTTLPAPALLARALRERTLGEYDAMAEDVHALLEAYPDAAEA